MGFTYVKDTKIRLRSRRTEKNYSMMSEVKEGTKRKYIILKSER